MTGVTIHRTTRILGCALTLVGSFFGVNAYLIEAPLIWVVGLVVALYGVSLLLLRR